MRQPLTGSPVRAGCRTSRLARWLSRCQKGSWNRATTVGHTPDVRGSHAVEGALNFKRLRSLKYRPENGHVRDARRLPTDPLQQLIIVMAVLRLHPIETGVRLRHVRSSARCSLRYLKDPKSSMHTHRD